MEVDPTGRRFKVWPTTRTEGPRKGEAILRRSAWRNGPKETILLETLTVESIITLFWISLLSVLREERQNFFFRNFVKNFRCQSQIMVELRCDEKEDPCIIQYVALSICPFNVSCRRRVLSFVDRKRFCAKISHPGSDDTNHYEYLRVIAEKM